MWINQWNCGTLDPGVHRYALYLARISNGCIIFPGDFVEFPPLRASPTGRSFTFGRVVFIGRDRRQASATKDLVVVTLQAVVYPYEIPPETCLDINFHNRSLILLEDEVAEVAITSITSKVKIQLCYEGEPLPPLRRIWTFR
jgi:hypothetical protein